MSAPPRGPLPPHHHVNWALTIVAVIAAVAGIALGFVVSSHIRPKARTELRVDAMQAAVSAASSPVPGCNPAGGAGRLGSCAPTQAFGAANALAKAAGDPEHISGHPVGVDVSSYQGCSIDWRRVHVDFMFFKATESTTYTDACLAANVRSAKRAHKPFGVYDFLRPSFGHSATAEANHFVAAVRAAGAVGSLPPVADVEVNAGLSPAQLHNYVCTWHRVVSRALHVRSDISYTGNWFWAPSIVGDSCGSSLWVSAYAFAPIIPRSWQRYTFWQYSDGVYGPTPHINGWDSDVFAGSRTQLLALVGTKPKPKHHPRPKRHVAHKAKHAPKVKHTPRPRVRRHAAHKRPVRLCHPRFHRHHICPPGTRRVGR